MNHTLPGHITRSQASIPLPSAASIHSPLAKPRGYSANPSGQFPVMYGSNNHQLSPVNHNEQHVDMGGRTSDVESKFYPSLTRDIHRESASQPGLYIPSTPTRANISTTMQFPSERRTGPSPNLSAAPFSALEHGNAYLQYSRDSDHTGQPAQPVRITTGMYVQSSAPCDGQPERYTFYPTVENAHAPSPSKRKGTRASQACEKCRERKSKCDERRPCASCIDQNIDCKYKEQMIPKGPDKNIGNTISQIFGLLHSIPAMNQDLMGRLETRLDQLEEIIVRDRTQAEDRISQAGAAALTSMDKRMTDAVPSEEQPSAGKCRLYDGSEASFEDHESAAHRLLYMWPTINQLVKELPQEDLVRDYALYKEARGLLRLDGSGELEKISEWRIPSYADAVVTFHMPDSVSSFDTPIDVWSPAGRLLGGYNQQNLSADNLKPDLRAETVHRLIKNYRQHIHSLHPFMDMTGLERFLYKSESVVNTPSVGSITPILSAGRSEDVRSNKRKRSELSSSTTSVSALSNIEHRLTSEKSLRVVLIYFVLALGRICEHEGVIPGPMRVDEASLHDPHHVEIRSQSLIVEGSSSSPNSVHDSKSIPASNKAYAGETSKSLQGLLPTTPEVSRSNITEFPGLVYYREACRLLGPFSDSTEIAVAQARLLAGLYKGQLGRVQESWSWIADAARICLYQLRAHHLLKSGTEFHTSHHSPGSKLERLENTVLHVYWSTLQLESDILAELDYPHSHLADLQGKVPYPSTMPIVDDISDLEGLNREIKFYSLQLCLRKRLNEVQANLYGPKRINRDPSMIVQFFDATERIFHGFRELHLWKDSDVPASDILDARVRAKYYGLQCVGSRPFIDYLLHGMSNSQSDRTSPKAVDAYGKPRWKASELFEAIALMKPQQVIRRARICVSAAVRSTFAFDGILGRLILTNIVGTSHAQFANMLILAAVYHSANPYLSDLIPAEHLQILMQRTIRFLGQISHCSDTVKHDATILQIIYRKLFSHSANLEGDYRITATQAAAIASLVP